MTVFVKQTNWQENQYIRTLYYNHSGAVDANRNENEQNACNSKMMHWTSFKFESVYSVDIKGNKE